MDLSLQECTLENLEVLLRLSRETFEDAFAHLNDPRDFQEYMDSAFSRDALQKELHDPHSSFYFVYCDGMLAGYFKLNRAEAQTDLHDPQSLELERIYVHKDFQGKKIGQWMLSQIKNLTARDGYRYLWLGVWEVNTNAIRFYQKNGFEKFGEHPYFIGKDRQNDWLMRYDIPTL